MKILEITFNLAPGGGERFVVDLSNELAKDHEVTILTLKDDQVEPEKRQFYKFDISKNVRYKNLGLPKGFNLRMVWTVFKAIQTEKADIVHLNVHGVPTYCFLAILLLCRKVKFYQTIHSDVYNGYTNTFYQLLINIFGNRQLMGFAALSKKNYEDFKKEYPKAKVACIVNGRAPMTPTDQFKEVQDEMNSYKMTNNSKLFIHVARCNPVKNQALLVEAFNQLVSDGYNADLIIMGADFDNELGRVLQSKSCGRIHFIGTRKNVSDYMLNSDIFCLSSTFEGMPITMLEASLSGVPIVSTPICGAMDLIEDGKNGIKSSGYDKDSYTKALKYAYDNFGELKRHSILMKDKSPYTMKSCAEKYLEFFKR